MEAAWLSPGTSSSWGSVADLGKAVELASAISLVGVAGRERGVTSRPQTLSSILSKRGNDGDGASGQSSSGASDEEACVMRHSARHQSPAWGRWTAPQVTPGSLPARGPNGTQVTASACHLWCLMLCCSGDTSVDRGQGGRRSVGKKPRGACRRPSVARRRGLPGTSRGSAPPGRMGPARRPPMGWHSQAGSDMAVCEDLWELLEDPDGEGLAARPTAPTSRALKCCWVSRLEPLS